MSDRTESPESPKPTSQHKWWWLTLVVPALSALLGSGIGIGTANASTAATEKRVERLETRTATVESRATSLEVKVAAESAHREEEVKLLHELKAAVGALNARLEKYDRHVAIDESQWGKR